MSDTLPVWDAKVTSAIVERTTYYCCVPGCGETFIRETPLSVGMEAYRMHVPKGWKECWGALVCPKHIIHMRVDNGVEFDL